MRTRYRRHAEVGCSVGRVRTLERGTRRQFLSRLAAAGSAAAAAAIASSAPTLAAASVRATGRVFFPYDPGEQTMRVTPGVPLNRRTVVMLTKVGKDAYASGISYVLHPADDAFTIWASEVPTAGMWVAWVVVG
jgi:hypothetical protein